MEVYASARLFFFALNRCGSDKDPGFLNDSCTAKPEEDLISKSFFGTYSQ